MDPRSERERGMVCAVDRFDRCNLALGALAWPLSHWEPWKRQQGPFREQKGHSQPWASGLGCQGVGSECTMNGRGQGTSGNSIEHTVHPAAKPFGSKTTVCGGSLALVRD